MSLTVAGTDYVLMPVGTTGQRPTTPAAGMTRYNSTTTLLEYYNGTNWINASNGYSVDYLVVAGGGGSGKPNPGSDRAGAGGAGGLLTLAGFFAVPTTAYTITIGAGGTAGSASAEATNGSNTVFGSFTTTGGGAGGRYNGVGVAGGSGGGGGTTSALAGGAATSGQFGNIGGTGVSAGSGGGGGGAGSAGSGSTAGSGLSSSYSGSAVTYAAGGQGGSGSVGAANSGNGGGNLSTQYVDNFAGGSGIVIIRYLGAQRGTGGTVTSSGGYTIHTFTTSGTFTA